MKDDRSAYELLDSNDNVSYTGKLFTIVGQAIAAEVIKILEYNHELANNRRE